MHAFCRMRRIVRRTCPQPSSNGFTIDCKEMQLPGQSQAQCLPHLLHLRAGQAGNQRLAFRCRRFLPTARNEPGVHAPAIQPIRSGLWQPGVGRGEKAWAKSCQRMFDVLRQFGLRLSSGSSGICHRHRRAMLPLCQTMHGKCSCRDFPGKSRQRCWQVGHRAPVAVRTVAVCPLSTADAVSQRHRLHLVMGNIDGGDPRRFAGWRSRCGSGFEASYRGSIKAHPSRNTRGWRTRARPIATLALAAGYCRAAAPVVH